MKRRLWLLISPVAIVLAAVAATAPVATPAPSASAALRVVDLRPFTIRGQGFRAAERVTVVANVKRTHRRTIFASRAGSFIVRFAEYANACTAYNLRALGLLGSRVTLARKSPRGCPALQPIR